jgi:hypothetical protein
VAGIDQALVTKTKALSPQRVQLLQQDRATIANAVERMRAAPTLDRTAIDDIMQELERAGQRYERGFTETGKQPPGSFGGLGNLARGWRSLADSAPARDAEFSKFVDKATPALRKSENRANFVPGPLAGTRPVDKHAKDLASIRAKIGVPCRAAPALAVRSGLLSS